MLSLRFQLKQFIWEVITETPGGEWGRETGKRQKPVHGAVMSRIHCETRTSSHWDHLTCNTEHASELSHLQLGWWWLRELRYLSTNFLLPLTKALLHTTPQANFQQEELHLEAIGSYRNGEGPPRGDKCGTSIVSGVCSTMYLKGKCNCQQRNGIDTEHFYNCHSKGDVNGILWRSMQDSNNVVTTPTYRKGTLKTKSDSILQNFILSLIFKAALGFTLISLG